MLQTKNKSIETICFSNILSMGPLPMVEWKQLRRIGESFDGSDVPIANPSELTHTWRKLISKPKQGLQQDSQAACGKAATDVENR